MKSVLSLLAGCLFTPVLLAADVLPWQGMTTVGQARFNFLFWPVYEATLYSTDDTFGWPASLPFALALEYQRDFAAADLVSETRRQWLAMNLDAPEPWLAELAGILPDVSKGDTITLYVDSGGTSVFYVNGREAGRLADAAFSRQFAAIWLSPQSTRPDFSAQLTGERK